MSEQTTALVVISTPTIMDGYVVRWYHSEESAIYGREFLSASRNGVRINGFVHEVPPAVLARATEIYERLRDNRGGEHVARSAATHHMAFLSRDLTPIVQGASR